MIESVREAIAAALCEASYWIAPTKRACAYVHVSFMRGRFISVDPPEEESDLFLQPLEYPGK